MLRGERITARDSNRSRLSIRYKTGCAENGSRARHVANTGTNKMASTEAKQEREETFSSSKPSFPVEKLSSKCLHYFFLTNSNIRFDYFASNWRLNENLESSSCCILETETTCQEHGNEPFALTIGLSFYSYRRVYLSMVFMENSCTGIWGEKTKVYPVTGYFRTLVPRRDREPFDSSIFS